MAKKSESIKDKLNALKPSIPTNTRREMESQPVHETAIKKQQIPVRSPQKGAVENKIKYSGGNAG